MTSSMLLTVANDPEGILRMTRMLKENIERGHVPEPTQGQKSYRKSVDAMIAGILSYEGRLKEKGVGQKLIDFYDDLVDEMINAGLVVM